MKERFLILCRRPGVVTAGLQTMLDGLGEVEVVADEPGHDAVWYPDADMAGYKHLSGFSPRCRPLTAWARAWMHLNRTMGGNPANVWFIEDDVAGGREDFSKLADATVAIDADLSARAVKSLADDRDWPHWGHARGVFPQPCRSFNPLCRLSARLVATVLEFRRCHGRFVFQEVLFATLMAEHGLSYLDWAEAPETAGLFGAFRFRPALDHPEPGICHPVKDEALHAEIRGPADAR